MSGAALAGVFGGLHCVAMCGGIATGLSATFPKGQPFAAALRLNLGRVLGYALAGALVGGLGAGLLSLARFESLQLALRMGVGVVLMLAGLRVLWPRLRFAAGAGQRLWGKLGPLKRHLIPADTPIRQLALGALWGWMPCGLSATMLGAAWLTVDPLQGGLLMLAFGLGTWATMLPLTWSGSRLIGWLRQPPAKTLAGAALIAAGLLTIFAPWLASVPAMHDLLTALGCRTLPG
nr:sulfite exporter TauE/SafE family protein [Lysobacter sp. CAU 1642]